MFFFVFIFFFSPFLSFLFECLMLVGVTTYDNTLVFLQRNSNVILLHHISNNLCNRVVITPNNSVAGTIHFLCIFFFRFPFSSTPEKTLKLHIRTSRPSRFKGQSTLCCPLILFFCSSLPTARMSKKRDKRKRKEKKVGTCLAFFS